MSHPHIISAEAVRLARAVIQWWEDSPQYELLTELHQQEPAFVRKARAIVSGGKVHWSVRPRETQS